MTAVDIVVAQLDQAYNRKSWHGTNLRGSIRGLPHEEAVWRPRAGHHNIQEIIVHAAYWKYVVRRRLAGGLRGSFPLKGSNWFGRTRPDRAQWRADVLLLDDMHGQLRDVVSTLDPACLRPPSKAGTGELSLVSGIVAHDLYHAGQIQLLKRLRAR